MFEKIYLEISNICNLQCHFCPEVVRDKKIMSVDDFKRFALQIKPQTKQVCLHLMGEPLSHPHFFAIMNICDELGLKIFLTTNGTLISRYADKILHWNSLEQINFSVHSYFANPVRVSLHDYLRPILNFCDRAAEHDKNFYINLRLWNLQKTNFQKDQNLQVFTILNRHYGIELNENVDVKLNKSKRLFKKLYLHFDTEFIWPDLKQPLRSETGTCYGLRKQLAVHANGDVLPCCLDKEGVLTLGNMHSSDLKTILQSPRAKNIKSGFERGILSEELCRKCQYADRFREKLNET